MNNKTNTDLFLLLLQSDVKRFLESYISIPKEQQDRGFNKVEVDFYCGSTGNISLKSVNIKLISDDSFCIMFWINQNGEYGNNLLCEEDLEIVLLLPDILKWGDNGDRDWET